jgi:hypothetical protein
MKRKNNISVYEITRSYVGSKEEGVWYNDNYELICSEKIDKRKKIKTAIKLKDRLQEEYNIKHGYGDIYSEAGGTQYETFLEKIIGENETKEQ